MKILLYRWKAYNQFDIIRNLEKRGHVVEDIMGEMSNFEVDDAFASRFEDRMDIGNFDLVMSVNYFPIISDICQRKNIRYVSWCCDSPISTMHHESVFNSVNTIFTFDKFDQMIFEDDFTVPVEYKGSYIKDKTVFDQIEKLIDESDEPLYVHTTTMQNHQPYTDGPSSNELDNYLSNIKVTSDALEAFTAHLKELDEPTLVFMVGDHFPSFKNDSDNVYEQLGINSSTCGRVFEQNYFIWSNYGEDFSDLPKEKFSAFYVPYVILDTIGAPKDTFVNAMTDKMKSLPVYSTQYDSSIANDSELDVLTYDRVIGENISG